MNNLFLSGKYRKKTSKQIIITDISYGAGEVFISGVDSKLNQLRFILPNHRLEENFLKDINDKDLKPFSVVELDFIRSYPLNPHKENIILNPCFKAIIKRSLLFKEALFLLEILNDEYVSNIFGKDVQYGHLNHDIDVKRSIGTVKIKKIRDLSLTSTYNLYPYKISFSDNKFDYDMNIIDLMFDKFYKKHLNQGIKSHQLNKDLKNFFNENNTFVRVGLGREYQNIHKLFVLGIYSFPYDYKEKF